MQQETKYRWHHLPCDTEKSFPAIRNKHAVCISNGALYVCGGRDKSIVHSDLWRYHLDTGQWERLLCRGEKPRLLQEHTLSAYKDNLYIFGGQFASGTESETPLWILDLETLTWRKRRSESEVMTPAGRRGHSVVTNGNQMLVYGGYLDMKGSTSELWLFDMDVEMWHLAYSGILTEGGPGRRHSHSAVVYADSMWVVGGMLDLTALCDMWKWDFSVRRWTRVRCKNSPPEIHGHSACVLHGDMIVVGGENQWNLQDTVWLYNFKSLLWQKLKFDDQGPSPRSHHACVAVPTFLLNPLTNHSISHSEPNLRTNVNGNVHKNNNRPKTSPASTDFNPDGGMRLFKNRINPAALRQNRSLMLHHPGEDTRVPNANIYLPNVPNVQSCEYSHEYDCDCGDLNFEIQQLKTLQDSLNEPEQRFQESLNVVQCTERRSDRVPVSDGDLVHSRVENLRTDVDTIDSLRRTQSGGFENPLFSRESSSDYWELPPTPKRSHFSAETLGSSPSRSVSAGTLRNASNQFMVESHEEHLPGVVKSGSLDSLLTGYGAVKITYIQIDNDAPSSRNRNDLVLEDLEDLENCDLPPLVQRHEEYIGVSPSHQFSMTASGQFESSQDQLLNTSTDDLIEMGDINASNAEAVDGPSQENIDRLRSDFLTMTDRNDYGGPSFELTAMNIPLIPQNRKRIQNPPVVDVNQKQWQRHFPSGQRESVAGVKNYPVSVSMILCGGKEANRQTCDLLPMPMWRLDIVKT